MDGVEGFFVEDGEGASGEGADEEGTEEARGVGDGDGIDVVPGEVGVSQGFVDDGKDGFEMGTSGDFGDDPAIGSENVDLGDDNVAQNFDAVFDNGGSGFVTGGFDAEDFHNFLL